MEPGTILVPGNLVRFCRKSKEGFLEYYAASADGYMHRYTGSGYPKHRFPCGTIGLFIRPSAGVPESIGIILVDDKLLYISYDELEEMAPQAK